MSLVSSESISNITDGIAYKYYHAEEKVLLQNHFNIVEYLFKNILLNDIECRKIVLSQNVVEVRAAIYDIIVTKDSNWTKKVLEVFRNRLLPFQNPKIVIRILSYLKFVDLANCMHVCPNWKQIVYCLLISKYDEVKLEQCLLMNISEINKNIKSLLYEHPNEQNEKKASVFQLMLAMNPEKDGTMLEILQIREYVPADVKSSSMEVVCSTEDKIGTLIANTMSNPAVLTTIFEFLPLADIKNCRTVCRTWNTLSEPVYRKSSAIQFDSKFRPLDFLNLSKYLPLPELAFQAFKFRLEFKPRKIQSWEEYPMEGLREFLAKFGMNIRYLDLFTPRNLQPFLAYTSNVTELYLQTPTTVSLYTLPYPGIMIPWDKLHRIKILFLTNVVLEVDNKKERKRITPLKLHLGKVIFFVGKGSSDEIVLNDYFDFTKITDANVDSTTTGQTQKFDWSRDKLDAKNITFTGTLFMNAEKSKSTIQYFKLNYVYPRFEENSTIIKQFIFGEGLLSLNALSPSLEKLALCQKNFSFGAIMEPIYLPNLNYLSYQKGNKFNRLSVFRICPNLTDMEIVNITTMKIWWLPRTVKKLKMTSSSGQIYVVGRSGVIEYLNLDLLILDFIWTENLKSLKFDKLRPKMLVLEVQGLYDDEALVSFIRRNKNINKMYVKFPPLPEHLVFSGSKLSCIVDKECQYYEFVKQVGKAITSHEFLNLQRSLDMTTVMKGCFANEEKHSIVQQRRVYYQAFDVSEEEPEDDSVE